MSENKMEKIWMIRSEGGSLYEIFKEHNAVAIGWQDLAKAAIQGADRVKLQALYQQLEPEITKGKIISGASQIWRFVNEIQTGDWVVTYSPSNRTYLIGKISGKAEYIPNWCQAEMALIRPVKWHPQEILRDTLSQSSRNSLGAISTLFELSAEAVSELIAIVHQPEKNTSHLIQENIDQPENPFTEMEAKAIEQIKDIISRLNWQQMQELVAGILRGMGYKTQISPEGPDRGKDIIASPDGFGFEHPRIIVEIKHRRATAMGSQDIRSFTGG